MSEGRRVPTGERAERKRAAIIEAARQVFLRDGYEAGMDAIAARAGVSKVTIYNHFAGKEDLFTAVVGDALKSALGESLAYAEECLRRDDDVRDIFVATARAWFHDMIKPEVLRLRAIVTYEQRRFPELGRAWQENGPGHFRAIFAAALRRQIDQGVLAVPDIDLAITQFYSLVLYPHLVHATYGAPIDEQTADRLITGGVAMFLDHYRA
ncbi:TetR/AcrR family transcriptional regulator [Actinomadura algeriensis]|uniref:AcrR family transcriptional regulator n=1 Tax=Actinomadura algeriensis TaxID=1679523 RepID=A0ABR9JP34_9ACTN|nr:TetR/AcrR family transcriptional regulator [Actinomadura algeriensis]MBE1531870.1 AcrR family transcriptional regulator [Actinomadura algeriensis]